jgi:hypothetical protein
MLQNLQTHYIRSSTVQISCGYVQAAAFSPQPLKTIDTGTEWIIKGKATSFAEAYSL